MNEKPTYYDTSPEHNEQFNVEGFSNLLKVLLAIALTILTLCII